MDNLADQAPQSGLTVANGMARWHFLELVNSSCTKDFDLFGIPQRRRARDSDREFVEAI